MDVKEIVNLKGLVDIKNFNFKTILSLLLLIAGILFYIYWGITYGVWVDIGIYSITIVFVLAGIFGMLLSLLEENGDEE
ncbi:MAG: hypothetical protein LN364_03860 [Candidatus Thermoplasmatota archaeon]|nr:hypothetical protein [Candidatus Thermoplasmatota archaeon]